MTSRRRPLEKDIENKCVEHAEAIGWLSVKLDKAKRSWPDRLFIGPAARTVFVEFKRPGERRRKQQIANHKKLMQRGFEVEVIDEVEEFKWLLDSLC